MGPGPQRWPREPERNQSKLDSQPGGWEGAVVGGPGHTHHVLSGLGEGWAGGLTQGCRENQRGAMVKQVSASSYCVARLVGRATEGTRHPPDSGYAPPLPHL